MRLSVNLWQGRIHSMNRILRTYVSRNMSKRCPSLDALCQGLSNGARMRSIGSLLRESYGVLFASESKTKIVVGAPTWYVCLPG